MADADAATQPGIPPEPIGLAQQVVNLQKERDALILNCQGATKRADKRWHEASHARNENRRLEAANIVLGNKIMTFERYMGYNYGIIEELNNRLGEAPSLESMEKAKEEAKEQIRKQVEEEMKKKYVAQAQKVQAECTQKINAANDLLKHEREAFSAEIAGAKKAETIAAQKLADAARKLKDDNTQKEKEIASLTTEKDKAIASLKTKDEEIAYLKKDIQKKSGEIERLRNELVPRYTPERKSPSKVDARVRNGESPYK